MKNFLLTILLAALCAVALSGANKNVANRRPAPTTVAAYTRQCKSPRLGGEVVTGARTCTKIYSLQSLVRDSVPTPDPVIRLLPPRVINGEDYVCCRAPKQAEALALVHFAKNKCKRASPETPFRTTAMYPCHNGMRESSVSSMTVGVNTFYCCERDDQAVAQDRSVSQETRLNLYCQASFGKLQESSVDCPLGKLQDWWGKGKDTILVGDKFFSCCRTQ